jgi:hypothetical protein
VPYRHAHYYVGFVLLVILAGFWASYFAPIRTALPLAFHVHAITAMTWLAFLIVQIVSIHRRMNALHRQIGWASFALFPLLMLGLGMIINVSADRYAVRESPFITTFGPSAGIGMAVAMAAYLTLFYRALKHRRQVKLHAGYMLATPMILFESPMSRVIGALFGPYLRDGAWGVLDSIVMANAMCIVFALALYRRDPRTGAPWLVAAGFMALQSVTMWTAPHVRVLGTLFAAYARLPHWIGLTAAVSAGAAAGWLGWTAAPPRPARGGTSTATQAI